MSIKFELDFDTFIDLLTVAKDEAEERIERVNKEEKEIQEAFNAKSFWYKLWHESDVDSWWYWYNVGHAPEIIKLYEKYSNLQTPPNKVIVSQRIFDNIKA